MEFWSTGVLQYKLALQYSITPTKDPVIPSKKHLEVRRYHQNKEYFHAD